MELSTEQINNILKSHGIDFSVCGGFYIIKEDDEIVEHLRTTKDIDEIYTLFVEQEHE